MFELPSGWVVNAAEERLTTFCAGEYIYYDVIVSAEPNRIEPLDVLSPSQSTHS